MNDLRERVARAIEDRVLRDGFATHEELADAAIAAGVGSVPADLRWFSTTAINGDWVAKPVLDHNGDPTENWFVIGGALVSVLVASGMDEDDALFIAASANFVRSLIAAAPTPPAAAEEG